MTHKNKVLWGKKCQMFSKTWRVSPTIRGSCLRRSSGCPCPDSGPGWQRPACSWWSAQISKFRRIGCRPEQDVVKISGWASAWRREFRSIVVGANDAKGWVAKFRPTFREPEVRPYNSSCLNVRLTGIVAIALSSSILMRYIRNHQKGACRANF